ncbi:MAG: hypothetical protein AB8G86_01260 [Saprospiraceae bacterium]
MANDLLMPVFEATVQDSLRVVRFDRVYHHLPAFHTGLFMFNPVRDSLFPKLGTAAVNILLYCKKKDFNLFFVVMKLRSLKEFWVNYSYRRRGDWFY